MYAYVQAFQEQVLVSVACNGAHSLKQRLARWLLMMRDRGDDDALQITQSLLAEMLGVQRPSITNAAEELERARRERGEEVFRAGGVIYRKYMEIGGPTNWLGLPKSNELPAAPSSSAGAAAGEAEEAAGDANSSETTRAAPQPTAAAAAGAATGVAEPQPPVCGCCCCCCMLCM